MSVVKILRRLTEEKAAGPSPSFTELHLAKAIEIIGEKRIGRTKLSERLDIGQGVTRTLIDRLLDANLVKTSRLGCELTTSGLSILNQLRARLGHQAEVPRSSITVGPYNFGILVRNGGRKIRNGIKQRDAAVRAGAIGAVTLVFKRGLLCVPPMTEIAAKDWEETARRILDTFNAKDSDAIMICGAENMRKAEYGARAAAWTIIDS